MNITMTTPALLFPAISLIMLAYTNRFLAIASVVRKLHDDYVKNKSNLVLKGQIENMRFRLRLIKNMQLFGVLSFLSGMISMYMIYIENMHGANIFFGGSMLLFLTSLALSLLEIYKSTRALDLALSDMEGLESSGLLDYFKKRIEDLNR